MYHYLNMCNLCRYAQFSQAWSQLLVTSSSTLVHYNPVKTLILACDASPYGVGAVLSHKIGDNKWPIAFTLNTGATNKNYSQIDEEALKIVFGVKHFHKYLFGQLFTIKSDHKPLQHLLGEKRVSL